eukprot:2352022-Heterocapsa_arctica.AAC.1
MHRSLHASHILEYDDKAKAWWFSSCCGIASLVARSLALPCTGMATNAKRQLVEKLLKAGATPWRDSHVVGGSD